MCNHSKNTGPTSGPSLPLPALLRQNMDKSGTKRKVTDNVLTSVWSFSYSVLKYCVMLG